MKLTANELYKMIVQPSLERKQSLADELACRVIAEGDDYVRTYHKGDVEGIEEGEYWVVSVQRRRPNAMVELADEFVYAGV